MARGVFRKCRDHIYDDIQIEDYLYSHDGNLETISVTPSSVSSVLSVKRTTNVLGRMTSYAEYDSAGTTAIRTRSLTATARGRKGAT